MSKRDALINAAKHLLWEVGYEAMSPAAILKESGAGQGSFYHHFAGKEALAREALEQIESELVEAARTILMADGAPMDRLCDFVTKPRDAGLGCRLGRLVNERGVQDSTLRQPIERYFRQLAQMLTAVLEDARKSDGLRAEANIAQVVRVVMAGIQGGFILAKAEADGTVLEETQQALSAYLVAMKI